MRDNPNAIGYDGLGYVIPEVKVMGVAKKAGEAYVLPSVETVNNGTYPISRDLYMYTQRGRQPGRPGLPGTGFFRPRRSRLSSDLGLCR